MIKIILRLDPRRLDNPDLDIRYRLPDLLVERSVGVIQDDGYDYFGDIPLLDLFLTTDDPERAIAVTVDVIENGLVLGNELRTAVVVAVERIDDARVVYPPEQAGTILVR